ncbi:MAG TPA: hypothetical protein VHK67_06360 [Rhabdochlamydiaceae bacterium]|jgi:hypothetical protein|nr:hypothetical protein [Rhabdochlamydiaceae bacterium]
MRKVFLFSLALMIATFLNVFGAASNASYQKLRSALHEGKQVTILLDVQQFTGKPGTSLGYFTPNDLLLLPPDAAFPERIYASLFHFSNRTGTPMYECINYTFSSDNSVVVEATFYDPRNYQQISTPYTFTTFLDKGVFIKIPSKLF